MTGHIRACCNQCRIFDSHVVDDVAVLSGQRTQCCYLRQDGHVFNCVCSFVNRVTQKLPSTDQIFIKFYEMVRHNPGTNRSDYEVNSRPVYVVPNCIFASYS